MTRSLAAPLLALALFHAAPAAAEGVFTPVALQRQVTGTFYLDAMLPGYGDLRLLLDTGSSYLVITEKILAPLVKNGVASFAHQTHGTMADGSKRTIPVYRLATLRLGTNCWVHDVEAAVFPGNTRPILGMNVLAKLSPFTFSADPAELAVQRCQAAPVPSAGAGGGPLHTLAE